MEGRRPHRPRRGDPAAWLVTLVAVALVAGACGFDNAQVARGPATPKPTADSGSPAPTPPARSVPPGPGGYPAKLTAWGNCGKFQCAKLAVPLDWSAPTGTTIQLAVIRKRHTDKTPAKGSIVFNPGGPGGSGLDFLKTSLAPSVAKALGKKFDLVSWDPRGTGDSHGIFCQSTADLQAPDLDPNPTTPEQTAAADAEAHKVRALCQQKAGDSLITQVGTRNTARDLDALRAGLGDAQLTYAGYSYGTTIGTEYAAMFAKNVRAMVLDGVAIPGDNGLRSTHDQGVSFEKALDQFLADCVKKSCPFGDNDPKAALLALQTRLHTGPRLGATYDYGTLHRTATVGLGELDIALVQAMYDKSLWPVLRQALTKATDPITPDGGDLLLLRDLYIGLQEDGSWKSILDANQAISCADTAVRATNPIGDPAIRARWVTDMPILGNLIADGEPGCYLQPPAIDPLTLPADGSITNTAPVVVVSSTGDPATPYANGARLARIITHSVLLTADTTQHTAYGRGSKCLDNRVNDYLVDLKVPKTGVRCSIG